MAARTAAGKRIADRYAAALFALTEERGETDRVADDLATLRAMIAASADLRRLLVAPAVSRREGRRAVLALAEKAKFSSLAVNLLGVLADNRRLFEADLVAIAFLARVAEARGEETAHVSSARPLTAEERTALAVALGKSVGRKVSVLETVDPTLLGGMIVKVGSRMVDSSLRTKLGRLRLAMKGDG